MSDHPTKPVSRCQVDKMDLNLGPPSQPAQPPEVVKVESASAEFTIKQHVQGDVEFLWYKDTDLWYECLNTGFVFPVPILDIGNAKFLCRDRALLFMRYIRKHVELLKKGKP